jgi:AcrR family transcriptional regulator
MGFKKGAIMQTAEPDIKMRILQAAKKLFARHGFEATTVRQICKEAKANVALVSYHFGGKENVFNALFETFFPDERINKIKNGDMDTVNRLKTIIREVTYFRLREPDMVSLLQQEITFQSPRIEKIRDHAFPIWRLLIDVLQDGREQSVFHFRSLDSTLVAVMGCIMFHNNAYYFKPLFSEQEPDTEQMIEDMTAFILNGLMFQGTENK